MTDITSPDSQTRAAVLESVRVRAALVLSRCDSPESASLIERAAHYRRMYTAGRGLQSRTADPDEATSPGV